MDTQVINSRLYRGLQTENLSYLKNPGSEPLSFATLGNVLEATAHKYPNRVAIKSLHEDVTFSYEELLSKVRFLCVSFIIVKK